MIFLYVFKIDIDGFQFLIILMLNLITGALDKIIIVVNIDRDLLPVSKFVFFSKITNKTKCYHLIYL